MPIASCHQMAFAAIAGGRNKDQLPACNWHKLKNNVRHISFPFTAGALNFNLTFPFINDFPATYQRGSAIAALYINRPDGDRPVP